MGRTAGGNVAERTLLGMSLFALAALAAGLIATAPAAASAPAGEAIGGADKLHGLDMMLIATSAHCDVSPCRASHQKSLREIVPASDTFAPRSLENFQYRR
jgi:hypothetical protein